MATSKLSGATIVFSGFTDPTLKKEVEEMGAFVRQDVSGKTTMVVAKSLNAPKETKAVAFAKNKGLALFSLDEFVSLVKVPPSVSGMPLGMKKLHNGAHVYHYRDMTLAYRQSCHILESVIPKLYKTKVLGIGGFFAYSHSDKCFVLIVKVKSMAPNAEKGAYDLIAAEMEIAGTSNRYLGYRIMDEAVPRDEKVDAIDLIKRQYGSSDLYVLSGDNII